MNRRTLKKLSESGYKYYFPDRKNCFQEAINHERQYRLNCSDFEKDLSLEATNRRILYYLKRCYNARKV